MSNYVPKKLPKYYSTSRELRNEAEKQRRNKLNHHVSELAALIPFVTKAQKKVDKTSILRLAASYLRLHKIASHGEGKFKQFSSLPGDDTSRNLLNSLGGFLLVITSTGKIVYSSEALEDTFGYSQADILGRSIFTLVHPDDVHLLQCQLQPQDEGRRSFYCRFMEKTMSRNEKPRYEIIHLMGYMKPTNVTTPAEPSEGHGHHVVRPPIRRRRKRRSSQKSVSGEETNFQEELIVNPIPGCSKDIDDILSYESALRQRDTHMFVAYVEIVRDRPVTELLWVESMRDEYITRHRLDSSIAYCDHRISFVLGLMPEEVMGHSAFEYMHTEDLLWNMVAQKKMLTSSQGQGLITYQLRGRTGELVSIRSRGFLEVNKYTGKVDSFVCINTLVSEKECEEERINTRKSLIPYLNTNSPSEFAEDVADGLPPELYKWVKGMPDTNTFQYVRALANKTFSEKSDIFLPNFQNGSQPGTSVIMTPSDSIDCLPCDDFDSFTESVTQSDLPFADLSLVQNSVDFEDLTPSIKQEQEVSSLSADDLPVFSHETVVNTKVPKNVNEINSSPEWNDSSNDYGSSNNPSPEYEGPLNPSPLRGFDTSFKISDNPTMSYSHDPLLFKSSPAMFDRYDNPIVFKSSNNPSMYKNSKMKRKFPRHDFVIQAQIDSYPSGVRIEEIREEDLPQKEFVNNPKDVPAVNETTDIITPWEKPQNLSRHFTPPPKDTPWNIGHHVVTK